MQKMCIRDRCIDEGSNRIYVPREDELLSAAEAGEDASKVIIHTESGKQRQLIIVKRAKYCLLYTSGICQAPARYVRYRARGERKQIRGC